MSNLRPVRDHAAVHIAPRFCKSMHSLPYFFVKMKSVSTVPVCARTPLLVTSTVNCRGRGQARKLPLPSCSSSSTFQAGRSNKMREKNIHRGPQGCKNGGDYNTLEARFSISNSTLADASSLIAPTKKLRIFVARTEQS